MCNTSLPVMDQFVDDCHFAPPFFLVVIDSRGTVSVTRYGPHGTPHVPADRSSVRVSEITDRNSLVEL